ncbi:MAG: MFS transporter [Actinomycetota bacterium]|nr:MFS transporter [Actinomycetota bacterium]
MLLRSHSRDIQLLAWGTLARSLGSGGVLTLLVLYFVRNRDFPAQQVGLALSLGGLAGVLASVPAGKLSEGSRSKATATVSVIGQGAAVLGYVAVGTFPALILAACMVGLFEASSNASRGALVAALADGTDRVVVRAKLRAVTNGGSSIGAAAGGVVLAANRPAIWNGAIIGCGIGFILGGICIARVSAPVAVSRPANAHAWAVLRDRQYAYLGGLNMILTMNLGILTVALPVWIASSVSAPSWTYGALIVLNTVLVVLFQVRLSKPVDDIRSGGRAMGKSGIYLAGCCLIFSAAGHIPSWWALLILVIGGTVHALGEMVYSAGSWALSYDLAPAHAHGQYQGMFAMSTQLGTAITPVVTTTLIVRLGFSGWWVIGALMLLAGLACIPLASSASAHQEEPALA